MRFHQYWAREEATVHGRKPWKLTAYGSSNASIDAARARAREIVERTAQAIERGGARDAYGYGDRPVREEVVEEIHDQGELAAVISRNSYGALVLNTSRVMFVDVDHASAAAIAAHGASSMLSALRGLFGGNKISPPSSAPQHDTSQLNRFQQVVESHRGLGIRVYRTAAGFRLLVTSATYNPQSTASDELLSAFGSDALYTRLCKAQDCYRARLSAKFWRCGAARPPSRYPWQDEHDEARYRQWEQTYHARANRFATCSFVTKLGEPVVAAAVQPIVEIHDRLTLLDGAPLA